MIKHSNLMNRSVMECTPAEAMGESFGNAVFSWRKDKIQKLCSLELDGEAGKTFR